MDVSSLKYGFVYRLIQQQDYYSSLLHFTITRVKKTVTFYSTLEKIKKCNIFALPLKKEHNWR